MAVTDEDVGSSGRAGRTRLNMWMNTSHYEELKMLAEHEGRTVSDIVRQIVNIHLKDNSESIQQYANQKKRRMA